MNDHAEGRVQSEELSHAVYGSICMRFNTKVKLLIVLEAIRSNCLLSMIHMNIAVAIVRQHSQTVSLKSGNYVLTCNNMAWHGTYSIHVYAIVCTFSKPRQSQSQLVHSHCSSDGSTTASSTNSNSEVNPSPTTGSSLHSMPSTHLQA